MNAQPDYIDAEVEETPKRQELAERRENVPAPITPMEMLDRALASGRDIETIDKLMALQERWEANQARKAFDQAMADAKAEIQPIIKNREVDFTSSKGRTHYRHEDLAGIAKQVDPILSKYGLSYRFRTIATPGEPVTVTCLVSHRLGYSEENTLTAGRDESGNKNSIQAIGSTVTYLQRYTLKAALGLAASNDDDGAKAEQKPEDARTISKEQAEIVWNLIEETGTDTEQFCRLGKIESIAEMPAKDFDDAVRLLNAKKARMGGGK